MPASTRDPVQMRMGPVIRQACHGWPDTGGKMIADFLETLK
jgi:hypothetical protein